MKKIEKYLLLILKFEIRFAIVLVIFIVSIEFTFRIYDHFFPSMVFPKTSYNRFRRPAGSNDYKSFKLNSKGFKDIEYSIIKPKNTFRIIGIGDSFVFGVVPYKYNFLTLLEDNLNSEINNKKIEVINMGIPSMGPKEYNKLFFQEGLELNPDLVLCFFYMGNDILTIEKDKSIFYLYHFFYYLFKVLPQIKKFNPDFITEYHDEQPTFSDDEYSKILIKKSFLFHTQETRHNKWILRSIAPLVEIKKECDQRNISFYVIIIPDEVQVNTKLQKFIIKKSPSLNLDNTDFEFASKVLLSFLEKSEINHIDLLPYFKKKGKEKNLYKPLDTHWNIAGNKFAAEILFKELFLNLKLNDHK